MRRVACVGLSAPLLAELTSCLAAVDPEIRVEPLDREAVPARLEQRPAFEVVVVGADLPDPIRVTQRVAAADEQTTVVLLTGAPGEIERALQFTPFLGEDVVTLGPLPTEAIVREVTAAAERSRRRRQHDELLPSLNHGVAADASHAQLHRQAATYLDALLDYAPIGIGSLDEEGRVLAWNRVGEQILGHSERELLGTQFAEHLAPSQHAVAEQIAGAAAGSAATRMVERAVGETTQFLELTMARMRSALGEPSILVVLADATARTKAEREREVAVRMREEFISMASHELRSPLTSILGFARRLRRLNSSAGEETAPIAEILVREAERMHETLELFLDLARLDAGRFEPELEEVDLAELANEEASAVRQRHPEARVSEEYARPVRLRTDPTRVRRIVANLLTNAVKYGGEPPEVAIDIDVVGDTARLTVRDNGPGISPEDVPHIFERFYRSRGATATRHPAGLGLGLYISREFALRLGGRLDAESTPGRGACFTLALPDER